MNRQAIARLRATLRTDSQRRLFDQIAAQPIASRLLFRTDKATGRMVLDAQSLPLFARQLEQILTEVEREEFPDLKMANGDIVPIDTSIDEGAETFTYYLYTASGVARFLAAYSTGSLPKVSIQGAAVTGRVENMGISYGYTTKDIRNAAFAGMPLDSELGIAARRAHEELLNKTGYWGREDLGLPGLFNHPNITILDAPESAEAGNPTEWTGKTVDEILADIALAIDTVDQITYGLEQPNKMLISRRRYNLIKHLRLTSGGGDATVMTVLKYLESVYPEITFEPNNELQPDDSDGNLTEDALFVYTAGNKRKAALVVPMPFTQYPVQQIDLEFSVPTESSTGGIKMPRPLMCLRMDGI